jgi:hypothetical protein
MASHSHSQSRFTAFKKKNPILAIKPNLNQVHENKVYN